MTGEERHETCRFGSLTPAFRLDDRGQHPTVIPLCGWEVPTAAPPAVRRAWGGAVEVDRDCANCQAYSPL